jgi:hypothetical protein
VEFLELITAVSHSAQFGDATTSSAGDANVTAGDGHLQISGYVTLLFLLQEYMTATIGRRRK